MSSKQEHASDAHALLGSLQEDPYPQILLAPSAFTVGIFKLVHLFKGLQASHHVIAGH